MRDTRPVLLLLLAPIVLSGCFTYHAAPRSRPDPVPLGADAWPGREPSELEALADATPRLVVELEADPEAGSAPALEETPGGALAASGRITHRITDTRLTDHGLLRVYDSLEERDGFAAYLEGFFYGFERNASFINATWFDRFGESSIAEARARAERRARRIRADGNGYRLARPTPDELLLVGTDIALGVPREAAGARGIVVHLPALMGNKYERAMLDHLEADGWTILHVESDVHVLGPGFEARRDAAARRDRRKEELIRDHPDNPFLKIVAETEVAAEMEGRRHEPRVVRRMTKAEERRYREIAEEARARAAEEIPMPETGFEIHPGDDLEAKAALLAGAVDEHLAGHAYAAEAAIAHVDERLQALADRPIVVIGFSAGSLAAPTVTARLREVHPDRVAAMVLIGSGAPVVDVARLSTLTNGGLELAPAEGPAPDRETLDRLIEHYLRASRLDPWHAAASLRDLPVLHVYATNDRIVPTRTARELCNRLGTPDRLVHAGDHLGLFYFLPGQKGRIAGWIDAHAPSPGVPDGDPAMEGSR